MCPARGVVIVVVVAVLALAQAASARSRSAGAAATVTILPVTAVPVVLPSALSVTEAGIQTIPLPAASRPRGRVDIASSADSSTFRVLLRHGPAGTALEVEVRRLPERDFALPLTVTYHQY